MDERQQFHAGHLRSEDRQTSARRAYNMLRGSIIDGTVRSGDRLIEDRICAVLATSRSAVREALRMLTDEGLVTRQRRFGTVLARSIIQIDIRPLLSSHPHSWVLNGVAPAKAQRIERRLIPSSPYLRRVLETEADHVVMVEDLTFSASEPISLRVGYFVEEPEVDLGGWASELDREHWWLLRNHSRAFAARFGTRFGRTVTTFEATAPDPKTQRLLNMPDGVPLLVMRSVLLDELQRPRELAYFHYPGNVIAVTVDAAVSVGASVSGAA